MGCASAKPKRTTSIDDITAKKVEPTTQDKNGQVNKSEKALKGKKVDEKKIMREKEKETNDTNVIQIPGAHKSFMAPDGIPFIDEDVESEIDERGNPVVTIESSANDSRHAAFVKTGSTDQNKNTSMVVVTSHDAVRPSALESPANGINFSSSSALSVESRTMAEQEPSIVTKIMKQEIQIKTTNMNQETVFLNGDERLHSTENKRPLSEEELAAIRIQAGIRGFLDRQKVKAIKANRQHSNDSATQQQQQQLHLQDRTTEKEPQFHQSKEGREPAEGEMHMECYADEPHDPDLDKAATKIQASYKGYRTRKVLKTQSP